MATRAQAKTAVDNEVTSIKADMDAIIPSTANYVNGSIHFSPSRYVITLSEANLVNATTLANAIGTNLTVANRPFVIQFIRRKTDKGKILTVLFEQNIIRITFS